MPRAFPAPSSPSMLEPRPTRCGQAPEICRLLCMSGHLRLNTPSLRLHRETLLRLNSKHGQDTLGVDNMSKCGVHGGCLALIERSDCVVMICPRKSCARKHRAPLCLGHPSAHMLLAPRATLSHIFHPSHPHPRHLRPAKARWFHWPPTLTLAKPSGRVEQPDIQHDVEAASLCATSNGQRRPHNTRARTPQSPSCAFTPAFCLHFKLPPPAWPTHRRQHDLICPLKCVKTTHALRSSGSWHPAMPNRSRSPVGAVHCASVRRSCGPF